MAVARALALYRGRVVPRVRRELERWRGVAAAIPNDEARAAAVAAIDEKGLNVEATAVFATLAPRRGRATATRAMVALQVAIDYLDSLGELPAADPLGEGLRQHAALTAPWRPEDPYLADLIGTYRACLTGLPAHAAVAAPLDRAVARCGEGQAHTHAAEHGDRTALEAWARRLGVDAAVPQTSTAGLDDADPAYRWWELAAGASSSVAAHALIAAAADPRTSTAEAEAIDRAYNPSVGALTVLLDDLIDRDEDAAAGSHNYLAYYADSAEAAERLEAIARLARAGIAPLRHPRRHAAILAGVAGFYLSDAAAATPYAAPVRDRLLAAAGPAVRPIVAVMRGRRAS